MSVPDLAPDDDDIVLQCYMSEKKMRSVKTKKKIIH